MKIFTLLLFALFSIIVSSVNNLCSDLTDALKLGDLSVAPVEVLFYPAPLLAKQLFISGTVPLSDIYDIKIDLTQSDHVSMTL